MADVDQTNTTRATHSTTTASTTTTKLQACPSMVVDYTKWDRINYDDYDTSSSSSVDDDEDNDTTLLQPKPKREIGENDEEEGLVTNSLTEMIEHVSSMNVNDAYYQLCLAQDEISRLTKKGKSKEEDDEVKGQTNSTLQQPQEEKVSIRCQPPRTNTTLVTPGQLVDEDNNDDDDDDDDMGKRIKSSPVKQQNQSSNKAPAKAAHSLRRRRRRMTKKASGSWLNDYNYYDQHSDRMNDTRSSSTDSSGTTTRVVSIEYLPNIQSYQITLIILPSSSSSSSSIPLLLLPTKDELHFTINPIISSSVDDD